MIYGAGGNKNQDNKKANRIKLGGMFTKLCFSLHKCYHSDHVFAENIHDRKNMTYIFPIFV